MSNAASSEKTIPEVNGEACDKTSVQKTVAVAGPSSSRPSPSKKDVETIGQAMQLLAAGKRDLLISDPNAAVISLAQACELLGDHYGEVAYECAEAYYYYGVALLDLARMEAGVIDNVMDGIPEDDDNADDGKECSVEDPEQLTEGEKEEVVKQVDEALDENYKELEKLQKEHVKSNGDDKKAEATKKYLAVSSNGNSKKGESEGEGEDDEDDEEGEKSKEDDEEEKSQEDEDDEEEDEEKSQEDDDDDKETEKGETEKSGVEAKDNESIGSDDKEVTAAEDLGDASAVEKEEEEDPSNLQLAWEMLDLTKTILSKKADALKEALESSKDSSDEAAKATKQELEGVEFRISDAYQTLGELSIENENYPQAIEDLNACLAKRQSLLPEDSRCIAETHYQLGVAKGFNLKFEDAVGSLNEAIRVLQKRIDNLKNKTESQDPNKAKDAFYTREREIAEIEKLIPEIREKIADTEDMKKESHKRIGDRHLLEDAASAASTSGAGSSSAPSSSAQPSSSSSSTNGQGSSSGKEASTISSSLIKKRKKSGGDPASGDASDNAASSSKKPHLETTTNGHNGAEANGN